VGQDVAARAFGQHDRGADGVFRFAGEHPAGLPSRNGRVNSAAKNPVDAGAAICPVSI
jgi:hypothetical protein